MSSAFHLPALILSRLSESIQFWCL